jgi:hypothetical protein
MAAVAMLIALAIVSIAALSVVRSMMVMIFSFYLRFRPRYFRRNRAEGARIGRQGHPLASAPLLQVGHLAWRPMAPADLIDLDRLSLLQRL